MQTVNDIPRRIQVELMTPAELAIRAAIVAVEDVGADVRLTEAVVLLQEAREKVADYIDATTAPIPPVDRTARTLSNGDAITQDHREIDPLTGQQKGYVVLTAEERAKGFVRPVRKTYVHKTCGSTTTMGQSIAETYARDPGFYTGTFCCHCREHRPLTEFVWYGTTEQVGS